MKVGFVGVGTMGEPMAANLLAAGFDVTVVAHTSRERVERLLTKGATEAATIAEVAGGVDVLVTCVPNDVAVEAVMLGPEGVAKGGREGLVVVDTSTIAPSTSKRVADELAAQGISMLDAPISGGETGAIAGTLAIMVGGPQEAYEKALPVLEAMGKNITYIGGNGTALVVKLCNNLIVAVGSCAVSEALTMAAVAGIDTGVVQGVLSNATSRSWIIEDKLPRSLLVGNVQPGFKLALMRKDAGLALDCGKELGVPMFVTALVHQLYSQALGQGKGDLDCIGVAELYTEATGVSLESHLDD